MGIDGGPYFLIKPVTQANFIILYGTALGTDCGDKFFVVSWVGKQRGEFCANDSNTKSKDITESNCPLMKLSIRK